MPLVVRPSVSIICHILLNLQKLAPLFRRSATSSASGTAVKEAESVEGSKRFYPQALLSYKDRVNNFSYWKAVTIV